MVTRVDKRTVEARRIKGARETLGALAQELLDAQLRLARFLAKVADDAHYMLEGCASIGEWAARAGIARREARALCDLGRALPANPDLEKALRERRTDIDRASIVSRILAYPEMLRAGDDWVEYASVETPHPLRRRVNARIEEHAQSATGVVEITFHVRKETKDEFLRARELASAKEQRVLTHGQTFHRIVSHYLDRMDPLRQTPGTRRVGDTNLLPESRYVPIEVRRAIWARSAGQCEFPGCEHRLIKDFCHIVPFADGSGREATDLFCFCSVHHKLFDAHLIRFVGGTVDDPIFWVRGIGIVCADTLAAGACATLDPAQGPPKASGSMELPMSEDLSSSPSTPPQLPPPADAETGHAATHAVRPTTRKAADSPPEAVGERGLSGRGASLGARRRASVLEDALVHC